MSQKTTATGQSLVMQALCADGINKQTTVADAMRYRIINRLPQFSARDLTMFGGMSNPNLARGDAARVLASNLAARIPSDLVDAQVFIDALDKFHEMFARGDARFWANLSKSCAGHFDANATLEALNALGPVQA